MYSRDLDFEELQNDLRILPKTVSNVKYVTSVDTICQSLSASPALRNMFQQTCALLHLYLTVPISSASSERSFSALRRIKTYLRNTMSQKRLNNCMVCHIHQDRLDKVSTKYIAGQFVSANENRRKFFGVMS